MKTTYVKLEQWLGFIRRIGYLTRSWFGFLCRSNSRLPHMTRLVCSSNRINPIQISGVVQNGLKKLNLASFFVSNYWFLYSTGKYTIKVI